jgi:hypothetical protein
MNELIVVEKIASVIKSNSRFPVDFDEAWEWIGYASKQKAKEALERNFELNIDYSSINRTVKREIGATNKAQIKRPELLGAPA